MARLAAVVLAALGGLQLAIVPAAAEGFPVLGPAASAVPVTTRPIDRFELGTDETRFGAFTFEGGLEVSAAGADPDFGGMSALRMDPDGNRFVGITDTGFWYGGRFVHDAAGRLTGVEDYRMAPLLDGHGAPFDAKWEADAEGMVLDGARVLVSFERHHRILAYPAGDLAGVRPAASLDPVIPVRELRMNRGMETVAVSPADGALAGARIAVSEMSINTAGDIFAAILDGPKKGVFFVRRDDPYAITDGAFLPNGDLLLLERRFSLLGGIGMRIVRVDGATVKPGATVQPTVVLEADARFQIDNMEGLDVVPRPDGSVSVVLVSDDNQSSFQRSLFLAFRYRP